MHAVKKFDFGNCFDAGTSDEVESPQFTEAQLDQARNDGVAEGRAVALAESRKSREQDVATATARGAQALADLSERLDAIQARAEADAVELTLKVLRKIVPHYAEAHGLDEIRPLVANCLQEMHEEARIVIRVHEDVLDDIRSGIEEMSRETGFNGRVVLFPEPSFGRSDCRVEWADGGAERNVAAQWEAIERQITEFLNLRLAPGRP